MRYCIQFLTATIIFIDQILTIIYYAHNYDIFADLTIRKILAATIFIVPLFNLSFSLYYLYPNHEENFKKNTSLLISQIKDIWIDLNQFHKDFFQLRKKGSRSCIILKILALCIVFIPAMLIYWTLSVIKAAFMVMNYLFYMLAEFSPLFSYSIYIAFFLWSRVMNCLNRSVITECLGNSKYRLLDSSTKMRLFCILINGFQAVFQAFPGLIVKSINITKLHDMDCLSILSIVFDILSLLFQIMDASLYKINSQINIEEIGDNNLDIVSI